jgi:hypothetical protein
LLFGGAGDRRDVQGSQRLSDTVMAVPERAFTVVSGPQRFPATPASSPFYTHFNEGRMAEVVARL